MIENDKRYKEASFDVVAAKEMYADGKSPREIGDELGVTGVTIKKYLQKEGVTLRSRKEARRIIADEQTGSPRQYNIEADKKLSDWNWVESRFYKKNGVSKEELAHELGVSSFFVYRRFIDNNYPEREEYYDQKFKDRGIELYRQGLTMQKISEELDINISTVSRWLHSTDDITIREPNSYDRPFTKISKAHQTIIDYITSKGFEVKINDRTMGVEFDIVVPCRKLAIEYNGLFYHSEKGGKDRNYHSEKTNVAQKNGYTLFHVYEDSWTHNQSIVLSMIDHRLGVTTNKISARKCEVKEIGSEERRSFFNLNHIQGSDTSTAAIGLFFNGKIVAGMSFRKARFTRKATWELMRYAVKCNTSVVGGFSRLLKHWIKDHPESIVSYSDNGYATGEVYVKNGFVKTVVNPPAYWYCDFNRVKRMHRAGFTKKSLFSKGATGSTEREMALNMGLTRIYDSGTTTWIYNKKDPN